MSLKDLLPEHCDAAMRHRVTVTQPVDMYVQGFAGHTCGVWLRIGDGQHTLIGYGEPDEALSEAEATLADELAKVRDQITARKLRILDPIKKAALE